MTGAGNILNWLRAGAPPVPRREPIPYDVAFHSHPFKSFGWSPYATALSQLIRELRQNMIKPVFRKTGVGKSMSRVRKLKATSIDIRTQVPDPSGMLQLFDTSIRSGQTWPTPKPAGYL